MPTNTRQYTEECQLLGKIWPRNATDQTVPPVNFPMNATNRVTVLSPWHSVVHIWARNLAKYWIPAPAILHQEPPCLLRHKFLMRDFPGESPIRGELFRSKLYTKGLSWHSISWHYPFKCNIFLQHACLYQKLTWGKFTTCSFSLAHFLQFSEEFGNGARFSWKKGPLPFVCIQVYSLGDLETLWPRIGPAYFLQKKQIS
jgi:hypothetical protein